MYKLYISILCGLVYDLDIVRKLSMWTLLFWFRTKLQWPIWGVGSFWWADFPSWLCLLLGTLTLGVGLNRSAGLMHPVNFTAHFYKPSLQLDTVIRARIDPSPATFNTNIVPYKQDLQAVPATWGGEPVIHWVYFSIQIRMA